MSVIKEVFEMLVAKVQACTPIEAKLSIKLAKELTRLQQIGLNSSEFNVDLFYLCLKREEFIHSLIKQYAKTEYDFNDWLQFVSFSAKILMNLGLTYEEAEFLITKYAEP
jgi:hypothetical protein